MKRSVKFVGLEGKVRAQQISPESEKLVRVLAEELCYQGKFFWYTIEKSARMRPEGTSDYNNHGGTWLIYVINREQC